jgi:[acyl-carrier-protein] S-malonyltransferase
MEKTRAFEFVCFRGEVMQACAERHKGAMFAVLKLAPEVVESICKSLKQVYAVNFNCPGQTVVACAEESTQDLQRCIAESGGKALRLAVSGAFHSPFMDDASQQVSRYLETEPMGTPEIPVYANMTAQVYGASGKYNKELSPRELLAKQINHPVMWQQTIENMVADGFDIFVEVGPGKTLTGLIKKIADVRVYNVSDAESLETAVREIGQLKQNK